MKSDGTLKRRLVETVWDALPAEADKNDVPAAVEAVLDEIAAFLHEQAEGKHQPHIYMGFARSFREEARR